MRSAILFFNDTATTQIYTLALHDALPIFEEDVKDAIGVLQGVPPVLITMASSSNVLPGIAAGAAKNSSWLEIAKISNVSGVTEVMYVYGKLIGVQLVTAGLAN